MTVTGVQPLPSSCAAKPPWQLQRSAALVAAAAVVASGCLSVATPRKGKPVEVGPGQALVFGRIRVTSPAYDRELLVFSRDPLEHVVTPDPLFNLELRGMRAPGGAVKYASHPWPEIDGDGSFHWILPHGEYAIASNPRPYGSSRFDLGESVVLARFVVPRDAGTVYLGTLEVEVLLEGWVPLEDPSERDTPYSILRLSVSDEGERAYPSLLSRYPSVPEPRATVPMLPQPE